MVLRSYAAVLLRMQHICCLSLLGFWALQLPPSYRQARRGLACVVFRGGLCSTID